ncbi:MAG: transcriptional regulator, partial [Microbacterium sp.]|nr:transcriptional regulator [Microbacterium sp.]
MTTLARPRTPATSAVPGGLIQERPMRYPDASSPQVMTRRGWWLVVLNFLIPGSAQAVAGNRRLGRIGLGATLALWVLVLLAAV